MPVPMETSAGMAWFSTASGAGTPESPFVIGVTGATYRVTYTTINLGVTLMITPTPTAVSVNWGDGTTDTIQTHTNATAGTRTVAVTITPPSGPPVTVSLPVTATALLPTQAAIWITRSFLAGKIWKNALKTQVATADGDPIYAITDPDTGADYTLPAGATPPTLRSEPGSQWSAEFDGVNNRISNASVATSQPCYIAGVFKRTDLDFAYLYSGTADFGCAMYQSGHSANLYAGTTLANGNVDTGVWYRSIAKYDGANSQIIENGVVLATGNAGTNAAAGLVVGNRYDGALPFRGRIAVLIPIVGPLTDGQVADLDAILATFVPPPTP